MKNAINIASPVVIPINHCAPASMLMCVDLKSNRSILNHAYIKYAHPAIICNNIIDVITILIVLLKLMCGSCLIV